MPQEEQTPMNSRPGSKRLGSIRREAPTSHMPHREVPRYTSSTHCRRKSYAVPASMETAEPGPVSMPVAGSELLRLIAEAGSSRQLPSLVVRRWATDPSDRQPWDGVPASGEPVKPLPVWVESEHSTTDTIEG